MTKRRPEEDEPRPDSARRPPAGRLRRVLVGSVLGLVVAIALLVLFELALALIGAEGGDEDGDPFVGFAPGSTLFEQRTVDGEERWVTRPAKLRFFNRQSFPVDKAPATFRVFTLGGSTTYGRPYDDRVSFANQLRLYLEAADPSRRWEVINAGGISYASYRVALLMRELVRYEPDLFVLYTGHNEFLEERSYGEILDQPEALRGVRGWLSGFRFARLARRGLGGGAAEPPAGEGAATSAMTLAPEVATRLESWTGLDAYQRDEELQRSVIEHFQFNLGRMADMAADAGAGLVMVVPVSNVKDFSPFKSQSGADLGDGQRLRAAELRARGTALLASGDAAAAQPVLSEAVAADPLYAGARFALGRAWLAQSGEPGAVGRATGELVAARELDVAPLRAIQPLVQAVREAGYSRGLPVVDLPQILRAEASERFGVSQVAASVPGDELLLDHVHLDVPVHGLIAEKVVDVLASDPDLAPGLDPEAWERVKTDGTLDRIDRELVASFDRAYYAERDLNLAKVLGWAGKLDEAEAPLLRAAEVLDDNADLHLNLGILYQRTGRPNEALGELERAARLAPASPEAHFNLGVVHGRLGAVDAGVEALSRAVDLRPAYPEAHYNLGVLLRERGDLEVAERALRRALELSPDSAEAHRALAVVLFRLGREDEAREAARRAGLDPADLDLPSPDPDGGLAAAVRDLRSGRPVQAERRLAELARSRPSAEVHWQHGVALRALGRDGEARAAYERALALDPQHAPSHSNLGVLAAAAGDLPAAAEHLEAAVRLDPGFADAWLNLGVVRDQRGDPLGAVQAIERAVALDPEEGRYRLALGLLYRALGREQDAREQLELGRAG